MTHVGDRVWCLATELHPAGAGTVKWIRPARDYPGQQIADIALDDGWAARRLSSHFEPITQ